MVKAVKVVNIRFRPRVLDGVPMRANLLDGTDFAHNMGRWVKNVGSVAVGGMNGQQQLGAQLNAPTAYLDVLEQVLSEPLMAGRTYTFSAYVAGDTDEATIIFYTSGQGGDVTHRINLGTRQGFTFFSFTFTLDNPKERFLLRLFGRTGQARRNIAICCAKLEEVSDGDARPSAWCLSENDKRGARGTRGAAIRGPQLWESLPDGYAFESGAEGEDYHDVVIKAQGESGTPFYYACTKSHTKSAERAPRAGSAWWAQTQRQELVATDLLLAQRALIKNLVAEEIEARTGQTGAYTLIAPGIFEIGHYATDGERKVNFRIAQDSDGDVVLQYLKGGEVVGAIDSNIFTNASGRDDVYELVRYKKLNISILADFSFNLIEPYFSRDYNQYYLYKEGYTEVGGIVTYKRTKTATPSEENGKTYTSRSLSRLIPDGYYVEDTRGQYLTMNDGNPYEVTEEVSVYHFQNGVATTHRCTRTRTIYD